MANEFGGIGVCDHVSVRRLALASVVFAGLLAVSTMVGGRAQRDAIALAETTDAEKPSIDFSDGC